MESYIRPSSNIEEIYQCGLNKLTEEEQWKKLRLVQEIAKEVWR